MNNPARTMTIMAGIPGSGKTTEAEYLRTCDLENRNFYGDTHILSTDDFWSISSPEYNFDPTRIAEAHVWNFKRTVEFATRETDQHIIIDNTNTSLQEIAPYMALGQAFGMEVNILIILGDWKTAFERQTHGVPVTKVYQMQLRLEDMIRNLPPYWNARILEA